MALAHHPLPRFLTNRTLILKGMAMGSRRWSPPQPLLQVCKYNRVATWPDSGQWEVTRNLACETLESYHILIKVGTWVAQSLPLPCPLACAEQTMPEREAVHLSYGLESHVSKWETEKLFIAGVHLWNSFQTRNMKSLAGKATVTRSLRPKAILERKETYSRKCVACIFFTCNRNVFKYYLYGQDF